MALMVQRNEKGPHGGRTGIQKVYYPRQDLANSPAILLLAGVGFGDVVFAAPIGSYTGDRSQPPGPTGTECHRLAVRHIGNCLVLALLHSRY